MSTFHAVHFIGESENKSLLYLKGLFGSLKDQTGERGKRAGLASPAVARESAMFWDKEVKKKENHGAKDPFGMKIEAVPLVRMTLETDPLNV